MGNSGMQMVWVIIGIAMLISLFIRYPLIVGVVAFCVWVYYKNPWGLKMKTINLWKKVRQKTKRKPKQTQPLNRRPRI